MSVEQANAALTAPGSPFELEMTTIHGVEMEVYKNAYPTLRALLEHGSATWAPRDMVVFEDERVTFAAHFKAVAHLANAFVTTYGLKKGDRVAICMRNYPQWPVAFWACMVAGLIATPLNSWWKGEELEYGLANSGCRLAVLDPQIFERVQEHWAKLPDLEHVIIARCEDEYGDPNITGLEELIGGAKSWANLPEKALPELDIQPDDDATIMYSSGTTGKPKGVLATHRAIISNIFNSMGNQARALLRRGDPIPVNGPDEPQKATLLSVPFFHATGAFAVLVPTLHSGQKIVTMYKWDAGEALPIIEKERITVFGGVPAIAWQVLEHPDRDKYDLSSVEGVSYGGAPSAPELVATIKRTFKDAHAANGWGMTETCATATVNLAEDYIARPQSAGLPGMAMKLKVVGSDGKEVAPGEIGELWCFGPSNARLYWNRPEATAETFIDGWVVTGDLAKLDEEGYVYLVDRAKDMLIRGGENIYCIEVENVLYEHPAIMDAAVVGIPDKVLGEEVGAVVQLKPGKTASEQELRHFVASKLAAFKVPKKIEFQTEPLPRNANGKILKGELREHFAQTTAA
ncbi:class I adenylate-forming enzyme family protein [Ponticaulis sp.]|uniref:class I adenylate-forming enzyme family protein n=1 Tax=Ponticaulis sp. TaxID=2020902 RepID=UPI000B6772AC|nr:fatty acid--CoA ligase [Ponticaulis sp.]OUY00520.1 MAG: fatty acid--CoA ligase [Hyphomonadaceae bacterium TMED5]|tara:strand:- start:140723 stop:142444 length:1722 start_codon:yes stop_codon:yes gene_type:complete